MSVSIYEFDEVLYEKTLREEGIAIGEARGIAIGEAQGIAIGETRGRAEGKYEAQKAMIISFATKHNISIDEAMDEFDLSEAEKAELLQSIN